MSATALDAAAEHSKGATASYFKELIRRSVLTAAEAEVHFGDDVLLETLDEMLDESQSLTRALLGSGGSTQSADALQFG